MFPFDFTIDHLPGSKIGRVDNISRKPQQEGFKVSTYDIQFNVSQLDAINCGAKQFLLKENSFTDFAPVNWHRIHAKLNNSNNDGIGTELATRSKEVNNNT